MPLAKHESLSNAATRFANVLRLYAEASLTTRKLFQVDSEEAIDNLDRAFDALVGGLHSLYDVMRMSSLALDWYGYGDTAACIVVRNARHHNLAGLFQSWNCLMLKRGQLKEMAGATFLLVGYQLKAEDGVVSEYYVPWDDFRALLSLPQQESKIRDIKRLTGLFETECGFGSIRKHSDAERFPQRQVFLNLIPVVMNAATRAFAALRAGGLRPEGFDWSVYADHFASSPLADLTRPTFKVLRAPAG